MDDKELAREGKGRDPRLAKDVASSGGIFFDIAVRPDLIRGGNSMQRYVWFFAYVCMCSSWLLIDGSLSIPIPYRRASAR